MPFGDMNVDFMIILKLILKELSMGVWLEINWLRTESSGRFCEHGSECTGYIERETVGHLNI
jgi:hypothetical protein